VAWCVRQILPTFLPAFLLLLLATAANVAVALLFQPLFDQGVLARQASIAVAVVVLQAALAVARAMMAGAAFDLFARTGARIGQDLTLMVFDRITRHSLRYFLDHPQQHLLQILRNDVLVLELNVGQVLAQATIATLQTVLILAALFLWEPRLAALCVAGVAVGAVLIWLSSRIANRALKSEIAANESVAGHLLALLGPRGTLLRVSAAPDWPRNRLREFLGRYRGALVRRRVLPNWVNVAGEGVSTATYFFFYLIAAYLVSGGSLSTGTLVAMTALVSFLIGSMNQLAPTYLSLADAWLRFDRMEKELSKSDGGSGIAGKLVPSSLSGSFQLQRVTVRHKHIIALDDVSVRINPKRITAIVGQSGAGKTTLALLLLGLIEPDAGQVIVDDHPIGQYQREALWRHIGFVPQEPVLFHASAHENILLGRQITDAEVVDATTSVALQERLRDADLGGDADLGETGFRLSSGERQRIALARAVVAQPAVLLLDEPTANLDASTEAVVRKMIADQKAAGRTVVVITHSPAMLTLADDVILLHKGRLLCSGPAAEKAIQSQVAEYAIGDNRGK
jgi:ABC-type bacteriocin/lantibiotic exporter with double-glycine peptidase domain